MYRSALRATPRISSQSVRHSALRSAAPRRLASTALVDKKSRSWKSSAARWGLAIGALYYYNTSTAFAEEPLSSTVPAPAHFSNDDMTTVDAIVAQKRKEAEARQHKAATSADSSSPKAQDGNDNKFSSAASSSSSTSPQATQPPSPAPEEGSPEALEAEADQQGAFNPETGEINWDCPCLGGMAHGPCGEDFKAAFSCFVYSTEEPKGMDCIDKFQSMQECFRQHPEIYGEELADDEEAGDAASPPAAEGSEQPAPATARTAAEPTGAPSAAHDQASPKTTPMTTSKEEVSKEKERVASTPAPPVAAAEKPAAEKPAAEKSRPEKSRPEKSSTEKSVAARTRETTSQQPRPDPTRDATQAPVGGQN